MKLQLNKTDLITAITNYLTLQGIDTKSKKVNLTFRGGKKNRFGVGESYAEVDILDAEYVTKAVPTQLDLDL